MRGLLRFPLSVSSGLLANHAQATNEYFDVNGSTTGSGVAVSGSYTFEASNFNTSHRRRRHDHRVAEWQ